MPMVEKCRSCGAPVRWLRNDRTAKMAPIDAEPAPDGIITIDNNARTYHVLTSTDARPSSSGPYYHSHFRTCPQRKTWQKKGEAS